MDSAELCARTRAFALRVIRLTQALPKTPVGEVLGKQLLSFDLASDAPAVSNHLCFFSHSMLTAGSFQFLTVNCEL
jgi:hypothetical protein